MRAAVHRFEDSSPSTLASVDRTSQTARQFRLIYKDLYG